VIIIWFRKNKVPVAFGFDYLAVGGALVHGFGKIGCFMAGCCHGSECSSEWGVVFDHPQSAANPLNVPLYPVQLWDAITILLIVIFMLVYRKNKKFDGEIFLIYAILYGILRFITENYRGDESRGYIIEGVLTHSQLIAVFVILFAFFIYVYQLRKHKITN
jgi:phosphatidylglycerol:prolipoprotein diacylglycerol transferase